MLGKDRLRQLISHRKKTQSSQDTLHSLILPKQLSTTTEDINTYDIGTYHPIYIGEVIKDRYVVLKKLNKNQYSTVCLCKDLRYNIHVAVKIYKAAPQYLEIGSEEFRVMQLLYRHSKNKEWQRKLVNYKKRFRFRKIIANENFCVKLAYKVFELFSDERASWEPSLCCV